MPRSPLPARRPARVAAGALACALGAGLLLTGPVAAVPQEPETAPAASTAPASEDDLELTIGQVTPSQLPDSGPIRIRGKITNTGPDTWTDLNLFAFVGSEPMTTTEELAAAAATEPTAVVGARITETVTDVEDLGPGESARYTIRVPRRFIDIETPGVYWFGVHALGQTEQLPRDAVADARARTFLTHLPEPEGSVETAILVPLRQRLAHTPQGSVTDTNTWRRSLTSGRLRKALDFGAAAADQPVTWLLDPAVPDAVHQLMVGNPSRSVSPTIVPDEETTEAPEPVDPDPVVADTPAARAAEAWLGDAEQALPDGEVLTLPYGDLDLAAAGDHAPDLYDVARQHPGSLVQEWDVQADPAVGAPDGYLDKAGLDAVDDNALVILSDRMFADEEIDAGEEVDPDETDTSGTPGVASISGRRALVTSYDASSGGPGPDRRRAPVALRQRVVAEAAVRLLAAEEGADPEPLVVELQGGVNGRAEKFWEGLDQSWIDLTTAADLAAGPATPVSVDDLIYPRFQEGQELDARTMARVERILADAPVLQRMLALNETIADRLIGEALAGVGQSHRGDVERAHQRLAEIHGWMERRLDGVSILAPPGVTLSSDSGEFAITLRNSLEQPVSVGIEGDSGNGASIDPVEPVVIPAEGHITVPLTAHTRGPGVHNLRLVLTDPDGTHLDSDTVVPVRSGQVSTVIWWIIGTGAGMLFLAIGIRLYRRIRRVGS